MDMRKIVNRIFIEETVSTKFGQEKLDVSTYLWDIHRERRKLCGVNRILFSV
jgi:hypothetical protein